MRKRYRKKKRTRKKRREEKEKKKEKKSRLHVTARDVTHGSNRDWSTNGRHIAPLLLNTLRGRIYRIIFLLTSTSSRFIGNIFILSAILVCAILWRFHRRQYFKQKKKKEEEKIKLLSRFAFNKFSCSVVHDVNCFNKFNGTHRKRYLFKISLSLRFSFIFLIIFFGFVRCYFRKFVYKFVANIEQFFLIDHS